jgi:hypothetical protein
VFGQQSADPGTASFRNAIALEQKFNPGITNFFSVALQNFLTIGHSILDQPIGGGDSGLKQGAQTTLWANRVAIARSGGHSNHHEPDDDVRTVTISDPSRDFLFTQIGGFTHNNSSSAWCGHHVVTAFMNSTGVIDTDLVPLLIDGNVNISPSFVGISLSNNDGKSFVDEGYVPAGAFPNTIFGNPVVTCSSQSRFYLATSFQPGIVDPSFPGSFQPLTAVGISISNDGGRSWKFPVAAALKDGAFHFIDKGWLAVDPSEPNRLYVSYTDFDLEGLNTGLFPSATCPGAFRTAIEMVKSVDGGQTWGVPLVLHEDCEATDLTSGSHLATGSQVAVGPRGNVYICYDVFPIGPSASSSPIQLTLRRSSDGKTFGPETTVDTIIAGANSGASFDDVNLVFSAFLQGFFRNLPLASLAVDPSSKGQRDLVYIAWPDGRDTSQVELIAGDGKYHFSDVLFSRSSDGGATWSRSAPVSPADPDSPGRDQFQPTIAVDQHGDVAACYYDRRNDPANNAVDRYCSLSGDHGRTFHDVRQTKSSWIPSRNADLFIEANSLGDYDALAAHMGSTVDDDIGSFFDSFQVVNDAVTTVRGRRIGRE